MDGRTVCGDPGHPSPRRDACRSLALHDGGRRVTGRRRYCCRGRRRPSGGVLPACLAALLGGAGGLARCCPARRGVRATRILHAHLAVYDWSVRAERGRVPGTVDRPAFCELEGRVRVICCCGLFTRRIEVTSSSAALWPFRFVFRVQNGDYLWPGGFSSPPVEAVCTSSGE